MTRWRIGEEKSAEREIIRRASASPHESGDCIGAQARVS